MNKNDIKKDLKTILSEILNMKEDEDFENLSIHSCDQWDSMAMVNIVLNVEKVFAIKISSDDLSKFTSYHNIFNILQKNIL